MRITTRLSNERYLDLDIDVANRICNVVSALPEITKAELQALADEYQYTIKLPISDEEIKPDKSNESLKINLAEINNWTTFDLLTMILFTTNFIITEK